MGLDMSKGFDFQIWQLEKLESSELDRLKRL